MDVAEVKLVASLVSLYAGEMSERKCKGCDVSIPYEGGSGQPPKWCDDCRRKSNLVAAKKHYRKRKANLAGKQAIPAVKLCRRCGETKAGTDFGPHVASLDGLQDWCRNCQSEYQKENRDQANERSRRFRELNPEKAMVYVRKARREALCHYGDSENPCCACCGESEWEFLVLDHVNGGGTAHRKEIGGTIWYWLRARSYPDGFQVLCWNCNAAKAYHGECPHEKNRKKVA
ncbi:hypothetical protein MUP79_04250 [Candidatus Bathyarchaeota archaeon]|nr:hypothetical protein [Candidatus Bathyarchaeota archaeon]